MTEWLAIFPYVKDIAMMAAIVIVWLIGRERRLLDNDVKNLVQNECKSYLVGSVSVKDLELLESRLLRIIDQTGHKAKHDAITDQRVSGKILEISREFDERILRMDQEFSERVAEIEKILQNATITRRPRG